MATFYGTLTLAFLLGLGGPAWAVDGVKLLRQPSTFPIVINQPGSYRVKTNIVVPDANTTAISVQTDDVTIDLNGFAILGPTVCTGSPVTSCAPTGTGDGIGIGVGAGKRVAVRNGSVQGMGRDGVALGLHARVEGVRAVSNGDDGIQTDTGSWISGNITSRNGKDVGGNGINAFISVVRDNVAEGNQGSGISCQQCTITGNTVSSNGNCGINDLSSSTLIGNTATYNVLGMCLNDGGNSKAGYANNVLNDNNGGNANPQLYGGVQMGTNICGADTVCP